MHTVICLKWVGWLCSSRAMFVQQILLLIIIIKNFRRIIQLQCIYTADILVYYNFVLQVKVKFLYKILCLLKRYNLKTSPNFLITLQEF